MESPLALRSVNSTITDKVMRYRFHSLEFKIYFPIIYVVYMKRCSENLILMTFKRRV